MSRNVFVDIQDPQVAALIGRTLDTQFRSRRLVPGPQEADTAIVDHRYDHAQLRGVHDVLILYPRGEECRDPRARDYLSPMQAESLAFYFLLDIGDTFDAARRVP